MNAKRSFVTSHYSITIAAAALSTIITLGQFTALASLFDGDGTPFERALAAEHACAHYAFISERVACVGMYDSI
jgi:hypothetical protein